MRLALAALAFALATPAVARDPLLTLPVSCTLGQDCYVQHYVDRDPSPGVLDFMCGTVANDGHGGIDIALPSQAAMEAGVDVIAAAPGRVTGLRDGMADRVYTPAHDAALAGRTCGNGVHVNHGGGWETQYCHLKEGSIAVALGQRVATGTVLGQVGMSGRAQFPHVEMITRKDGQIIDPFDPSEAVACGTPPARSLWQTPIAYVPAGIAATGFSDQVPSYEAVKAGTAHRAQLEPGAPGLAMWGLFHNVRPGDLLETRITRPDGTLLHETQARFDRAQALAYRATGRRGGAAGWPAGIYRGEMRLWRDGRLIDTRQAEVTIRAR